MKEKIKRACKKTFSVFLCILILFSVVPITEELAESLGGVFTSIYEDISSAFTASAADVDIAETGTNDAQCHNYVTGRSSYSSRQIAMLLLNPSSDIVANGAKVYVWSNRGGQDDLRLLPATNETTRMLLWYTLINYNSNEAQGHDLYYIHWYNNAVTSCVATSSFDARARCYVYNNSSKSSALGTVYANPSDDAGYVKATMPGASTYNAKTGYTVSQWALSTSSGTLYYSPGATTPNLAFSHFGDQIDDGSFYSAKTYIYPSSFTANTYTVNYYDGSTKKGSSSHTYDTAKALTSASSLGLSKTGYTFSGWATSNGGSKAYSNGQSVSNLTSTNGGTVNLYAVWTPNTYTVNYYNGTTKVGSSSHTYGATTGLTTASSLGLTTGYTFEGWATSNGGSVVYTDGQAAHNLTSTNGGTVNLYAVRSINSYTVTYYYYSDPVGYEKAKTETYNYNTTYTLAKASTLGIIPSGYTFIGWNPYPGSYSSAIFSDGASRTISNSNQDYWAVIKVGTPAISTTNYVGGKTVSISIPTGSTVYYTTDGTDPTTSSTKYTGAFNLTSTKTVKAIAVRSYYGNSDIASSTVTVSATATPTLSTTNYVGGKKVTLSCGTSGATIYYTTDGSTPTTSSTKYTGAFNLTSTKTVKAIATCTGYTTSGTLSQSVSVSTVATPTLSTTNYVGGKKVTLSCGTSGATIYYTTDGTTPTTSSTKYTGAFDLTSTKTVKAIAVLSGYANSGTLSGSVTVTAYTAPTISYSSTQSGATVTLTCSGASEIYYRIGTSGSYTKYTAPFSITSTSTINAYSTASGYTQSSTASQTITIYTVTLNNQSATSAGTTSVKAINGMAMPSITVPTRTGYTFGGYYTSTGGSGTQYYTASGASAKNYALTANTTLYAKWTGVSYTVNYYNGSTKVGSSSHTYGTAKALSTASALNMTKSGYVFYGWATSSGSTTRAYTNGQSVSTLTSTSGGTVNLYAIWQASTPSISTSNYAGGKTVSISCATSGATIYYTTDGSTPTTSSTKYTGAFNLTSTKTVKALAVVSGAVNSAVGSSSVTVNATATPTISTTNYVGGKTVSISCATSGATIYYTTDGTDPQTSSTRSTYSASFNLTSSKTVKACAVASGYAMSSVASSDVSISTTATPTISTTNVAGGKNVTITSTSGATIYYTTNGSNPTTSSTVYTGAFKVSSTTTVKALAVLSGYVNSSIATSTVSISACATPAISTTNYVGGKTVKITCSDSTATIYYTTDGSEPTTSSTKYTGTFNLTSSKTVKARAINASGCSNSAVASQSVSVTSCAAVTVGATGYIGGKTIELSCTTSGATIYYTTDGTDPTSSSTRKTYSSTFNVTATTTVKAYAVCSGYTAGSITTETVNIYTVATPTISASGYIGGKTVAITTTTSGATIYYTTDGTTPTTSSTKYSGTFNLTSTKTVKAIAVASGYVSSSATSSTVSVSQVANPTISTTNYIGGKTVDISCTTSGATIYYTTDGSAPTTSSAKYTGSFNLTSSKTVKAIAVLSGYVNSSTASSEITVDTVKTPTLSTSNYIGGKTVTLSCATTNATIYYTTDGTTPTTSSTKYTGAFNLTSTKTVKAIAVLSGCVSSSEMSQSVTVTTVSTPAFTIKDVIGGKTVTITCGTTGAAIYYTTDGTSPLTSSTRKLYSSAVTFTSSANLKAAAELAGYVSSGIGTSSVSISTVSAPTISASSYDGGKTVTMSCATANAAIYYTTDGTTPTTSSKLYSAPINITSNTTFTAKAFLSGYANSETTTAAYTVTTVATPVITEKGFTGGKNVTIACSTSGATIYYTLDGSAPTTDSAVYTGAITLTASKTVKAFAVLSGSANSAVASKTITIETAETPTFTVTNVVGGKTVAIASETSGATIYYTTDGTNPTTSSKIYSGAISVTSATGTIKAIAAKSGYVSSAVGTQTVSIEKVATPSIITTNYVGGKTVAISCGTADSTIYYTTDGSAPTISSTKYTGTFNLTDSKTVKAIAVKSGMLNSNTYALNVSVTKVVAPTVSTTDIIGGKTVSIATTTSGATIYYTTDGTTPTTSSAKYTGSFNLTSSKIIKAFATLSGSVTSDITTKDISVDTVSTPEISVTNFIGGKSVTINCDTEDAVIYYSTDGTSPTTSSKKYEGTINLTSSANIKAIAVKSGYANSSIATQNVTVDKVATPVMKAESFLGGIKVTLTTDTENATIYYTTDGSTPTTSSDVYSESLELTKSTEIQAIAVLDGWVTSDISVDSFTIGSVSAPVFTVTDIIGGKNVEITSATENSVIYYTIDGTDPDSESNKYTDKFAVTEDTVVKAIAVLEGSVSSGITTENISVDKVATPVIDSQSVNGGIKVTLTTETENATIYYTLDGTVPTTESNEYTDAFVTDGNVVVSVIAVKEGFATSGIASEQITVDKLSTPVITVTDATEGKMIAITCDTAGANIYYTLDGSQPDAEAELYVGEIPFTESAEINAIAIMSGYADSDVATKSITVDTVDTPVITINKGDGYTELTANCSTTDATIYYTTDGSEPTTASAEYTESVVLTENAEVKFVAYKNGMKQSSVETADIIIDYSIKYYVDGELYHTDIYNFGDEVIALAEPAESGHTFSGWSEIPATMPAHNITVSGTFNINSYTVTYYVDAELYGTQTYEYGADVTALTEPVKTGYTFSGWDEVPAVMPDDNIEVHGTFAINTYKVTYKVDGEVYDTQNYEYNSAVTALTEPVKTGYTFSGWDLVPEFMPAEDIEVNGTFTVNSYTITYKVDGEVYDTQTYEYGADVTALTEPVKTGYTFSGWDEVPAVMPDDNIEVHGTFAINTYKVTYKVDGEVYDTQNYEYNSAVTALTEPVKTGYTFSGWDEVPEIMPAEDIEVNGTFTVNSYTITYKVDGEVYDTQTYEYGADITPISEPERAGYNFSGWVLPSIMPAENIEVDGAFSLAYYTVKVVSNNGTVTGIPTESLLYNDSVELEATANSGYTFSGWYVSGVLVSTESKYTFNVTDDVTVTAKFNENAKKTLVINAGVADSLTLKIGDSAARPQSTYYRQSVASNQMITASVNAEGLEFLYWINGAGSILGYDEEYTFVFVDDTEIHAIYADNLGSDYHTVTFIGAYDQIVERSAYTYDDTIVIPTETQKTDYDFVGWSIDGKKVITTENLEAAIKNLLKQGNDVTVTSIFTPKPVSYDITVIGGQGSGVYESASIVRIYADTPAEGTKFAYWINAKGAIVAYTTTYVFYAHESTTFEAVFVPESEEITESAITYIDSVHYDNEIYKLTFVSVSTIPDTCQIISSGVIITDSGTVGTNYDLFTESNSSCLSLSGINSDTDATTYRYSLTKKNVYDSDVWYARSYLVYYDENGNICKLYGDVVCATVQDGNVTYVDV